ncbi:MAG TPA: hypothetical protein VGV10_04000 [Thermoleophilaceae bacterium]|nr:hypothetical protein [Thermoleophilaceae bacterium]
MALVQAAGAHAAELVAEAGKESLVVAGQGEVTAFTVELHAEGKINCGAHDRHPVLALVETSYSIVAGTVSNGGRPSEPQRFFRAGTAQPPPKGGCPVSWATRPDPYRIEASVSISRDTPPGDYPVVLRTAIVGRSGDLSDDEPTTIAVRVPKREEPAGPPPLLAPPAEARISPAPLQDGGLPPPRENLSVNLLPVQGRVLVRYPGSPNLVLLERAVQVPVGSKIDTTAGRVELVSDKDGKGGLQSATFWNGRFAVGYTRVAAARGRERRSRRRASRPITELTLAKACGRRAGVASATRGQPRARADRRARRRGLFGRGRGRFRTRGSHGAGTVRGTYWYSEDRCGSTFFRVYTGVVEVRDFSRHRTVRLRRKQSYLARSRRSKSD